ncbi:hypothetical protein EVAR_33526_1 [Eumeta japonica]|uniref:Uncharacterized protein n=1 Tax=Eumeta variegata TaxID=151549 RepID=A0A4C1VI56_EUMVA|nr:hypothetical protein EVAR_33526_1 [Eumeta japonica]
MKPSRWRNRCALVSARVSAAVAQRRRSAKCVRTGYTSITGRRISSVTAQEQWSRPETQSVAFAQKNSFHTINPRRDSAKAHCPWRRRCIDAYPSLYTCLLLTYRSIKQELQNCVDGEQRYTRVVLYVSSRQAYIAYTRLCSATPP